MESGYDLSVRGRHAVTRERLDAFLGEVLGLAHKHGIEVGTVIEAARVCELRRANDLRVDAGDILDGQLVDFGEILRGIADALGGGDA